MPEWTESPFSGKENQTITYVVPVKDIRLDTKRGAYPEKFVLLTVHCMIKGLLGTEGGVKVQRYKKST